MEPGGVVVQGPDTVSTQWQPYGQATYLLNRKELVRVIGKEKVLRIFFGPLPVPAA